MENEAAHHHSDPRPAEKAAAVKVKPHVESLKAAIMRQAEAAGSGGVIPDEVDGLINTVRRRFTDLWKEGRLCPTLATRKNKRGNPETIWIVGRDEKATAPRVKPEALIKRLEDALRSSLELLERMGIRHNINIDGLDVWPPKPCPMLGLHNGYGTPTLGCKCPPSEDLEKKRQAALADCGTGDHTVRNGVCLDCSARVL